MVSQTSLNSIFCTLAKESALLFVKWGWSKVYQNHFSWWESYWKSRYHLCTFSCMCKGHQVALEAVRLWQNEAAMMQMVAAGLLFCNLQPGIHTTRASISPCTNIWSFLYFLFAGYLCIHKKKRSKSTSPIMVDHIVVSLSWYIVWSIFLQSSAVMSTVGVNPIWLKFFYIICGRVKWEVIQIVFAVSYKMVFQFSLSANAKRVVDIAGTSWRWLWVNMEV